MANLSPEIDLNAAGANYTENDPVTAIAPDATAGDPDSADFDAGSLTVAFTAGATDGDQLRIVGGDFSIEESDLYYQGVPIGSVTGGTDGSTPLLVTFNADVTPAIAAALIRAIGYVNYSEAPVAGERVVSFTLSDGDGGTSTPRTTTVNVAGVDTAPLAQDDMIAAYENAVATGSLFVDNGNGNDSDADGPALTVSEVNGEAGNVGIPITLESGARLTVHKDGSYSYDPDGRFDSLADAGTGAVNSTTGDTFTYTLANGNVATVAVTVNGVASPGDRLMGDEGDNDIRGTAGADTFVLDQGGFDSAIGYGGDDIFYFGGAFWEGSFVDGREGDDTIVLQGDYGDGLFLRGGIYGIEAIALLAGSNTAFGASGEERYSYAIVTDDAAFAAGVRARINGSALLAGEDLLFDGSAETDASFLVYGGRGTDILTGGDGNDIFFFDAGRFAAGDRVVGGEGYDGLFLRGDYRLDLSDLAFAGALRDIENITLTSATDRRYAKGSASEFDYALTLSDADVAAGQTLTVSGVLLTSEESLSFNGSYETDGMFRLLGGAGNDALMGGANADLFHGGLGIDEFRGWGGADTFRFEAVAESAGRLPDQIYDFTPGTDTIDLGRIDADSLAAGDQAFTWIGSDAFSGAAGQLRAYEDGWRWMLEGDVDGDGQADFVLALILEGATPLGAGDFVL